jgi:hypothetical protein
MRRARPTGTAPKAAFPSWQYGPDELGRCPAERCPAPTVPGTFRIMVGTADVLGLKPITLEVALRDAAARLRA